MIDGQPYTDASYEWYPNFAMYDDEFVVNPGDMIVASINVTAPNRGIYMVENRSTGDVVAPEITWLSTQHKSVTLTCPSDNLFHSTRPLSFMNKGQT